MAISDKLVDKRIVSRNVQKGVLDSKDYRGFLEGLPDVAGLAEPLLAKTEPAAERAPSELASAEEPGSGGGSEAG